MSTKALKRQRWRFKTKQKDSCIHGLIILNRNASNKLADIEGAEAQGLLQLGWSRFYYLYVIFKKETELFQVEHFLKLSLYSAKILPRFGIDVELIDEKILNPGKSSEKNTYDFF